MQTPHIYHLSPSDEPEHVFTGRKVKIVIPKQRNNPRTKTVPAPNITQKQEPPFYSEYLEKDGKTVAVSTRFRKRATTGGQDKIEDDQ